MQIEIIKVDTENKGKYRQATVTYKTADGKVDAKKIVSFSYKEVFNKLSEASQGDIFDVKSEKVPDKSGKEFWHWTEIATTGKSTGAAIGGIVQSARPAVGQTGRSTYETPEERAAKQVYIVRQSSVSTASELNKESYAKGKIDIQGIIEVAKEIEAYVFSKEEPEIEKFKSGEVS